jgi:hypothetical protein
MCSLALLLAADPGNGRRLEGLSQQQGNGLHVLPAETSREFVAEIHRHCTVVMMEYPDVKSAMKHTAGV